MENFILNFLFVFRITSLILTVLPVILLSTMIDFGNSYCKSFDFESHGMNLRTKCKYSHILIWNWNWNWVTGVGVWRDCGSKSQISQLIRRCKLVFLRQC